MGKKYIYLDPIKDKSLIHIFNDLKKQQTTIFNYDGKKEQWGSISRKIGIKCKKLFDAKDPFMYPTSSARYHNIGFITRPPDIEINMIDFKGTKKIIFNRKIF